MPLKLAAGCDGADVAAFCAHSGAPPARATTLHSLRLQTIALQDIALHKSEREELRTIRNNEVMPLNGEERNIVVKKSGDTKKKEK
jgi:hypothetical protein